MKTTSKIRIGARTSPLAQVQVQEIFSLLKNQGVDLDFETSLFQTQGDREKNSSLSEHAIDDFFTDSLDAAVLNGAIDIAIHSAKDVPKNLAKGLDIIALTESLDITDAFVAKIKLSELPAGAKIGTSSAYRKEEILKIRSDIETLSIRGTVEDRIKQFEEGQYDGVIIATAALKRLGLEKSIIETFSWEATPLQGQLAIVARLDNKAIYKKFSILDVRKKYGMVHLVGAGPGDPDLMTLKAVKALSSADVVFYDYLLHNDILKHAKMAEKIYVGKRKGDHVYSQKKLCALLRKKSQQGLDVVRLKGGDPLIFGRGAEEMAYLHDYHIPYNVIPGISAATGILSGLGIPLTARDISSSVAFISGHVREESDDKPATIHIPKADTQVFFMGLSKVKKIVETLLAQGREKNIPVAVISRGSFVDERIIVGRLANIVDLIKQENILPPALIVVGKTVGFWQAQAKLPKNILFTGTNPEKYTALGNIIHFPMIQIDPIEQSKGRIEQILERLVNYDVILLTSQFGVHYFFEILQQHNVSVELLNFKKFFIIGRHTADVLAEYGFLPSIIANIETSEGMLQEILEEYDVKDKLILFPRSNLPNPYLKENLVKSGAEVDEFPVYQNSKISKKDLPENSIDTVFFTSPSTVCNFLDDYGHIPRNWEIISKGAFTSQYLKDKGYDNEVLINI